MSRRPVARRAGAVLASLGLAVCGGCAVGRFFGGAAQNYEYSKLIEVHPEYAGLENKRVAIVVDADHAVLYEHARMPLTVAANLSARLQEKVPGASVVHPATVSNWQFRTLSWQGLAYGEMADQLDVDRIILIDVHAYRLNPVGNRWLWEGICAAHVHVVERDGLDPDAIAQTFMVEATFPKEQGVGIDAASAAAIETGLLAEFVLKTSWLFYRHLEPKYPDKYKGPSPESREHELDEPQG